MSSQRDGDMDAAVSTTPEGGENNNSAQSKPESLLGNQSDLLSLAKDMGHIIGDPELLKPTGESSETEEQTAVADEEQETTTEVDAGEETEPEIEVAAEAETEDEGEEEHKSIDEQIKGFEAKGEKAPWHLSRISKLTHQKNEFKTQRDQAVTAGLDWKNRALEAENQLTQVSSAPPKQSDPLSNIFTLQDLEDKKREATRWIAWAENNRSGGEAVVGKNKDGSDITEYLDEKQVTNLKLGCDQVLRDGIPNRKEYLAEMAHQNQAAVEIYPEYKDGNSQFYRDAMELLSALRQGYIPPDVMVWIGHALKSRNEYVAGLNGHGKKSETTKRIVESARTKVAPTPTKSRGFVPRRSSVDLDTARKSLQEKGDSDSALKLLESLGVGGSRSKRPELVGK